MTNRAQTPNARRLHRAGRFLCAIALVALSAVPALAQQPDTAGGPATRPLRGMVVKSKAATATEPTMRSATQKSGNARIRSAPADSTRAPAVRKPTVQKQPKSASPKD